MCVVTVVMFYVGSIVDALSCVINIIDALFCVGIIVAVMELKRCLIDFFLRWHLVYCLN